MKKIKSEVYTFYETFKDTPYGSFMISVMILIPSYYMNEGQIFKFCKRAELPLIDDKEFFKKMCSLLNWDYDEIKKLNIYKITSKWNILYLPAVKTEDIKDDYNPEQDDPETILPVNKNGIYPQSFWYGIKEKVIWED